MAEGGANILPVSISGSGPAGKLEVSFLKFLSKITLDFQFHFLSRTDRLKDSNFHVAEPRYIGDQFLKSNLPE